MVALRVLLLAVAIGHVLGGPHPDDCIALAIACATRHIGIAVIVATAFRSPRTMVLLAAYLVTSAVVSIPYLQWRRRQARVEEPMGGVSVTCWRSKSGAEAYVSSGTSRHWRRSRSDGVAALSHPGIPLLHE